MPEKVIVVGAGPVGALAALYAAQRGHNVELYEYRGDPRDPLTTPLNFTRSINLALSERGIYAMLMAGMDESAVMEGSLPMRGRMIHSSQNGKLHQESQEYDVHGRTIYAVDRTGLNHRILNMLQNMENVKFFFYHKLVGADFNKRVAWFEVDFLKTSGGRSNESQVEFDFLIGADGAHSAVRYHLTKFNFMDYSQQYIDTLWCEFKILPRQDADSQEFMSRFAISPKHLHIWPGKKFMFIAIPSIDGTFVCTLFMPREVFRELEADPSKLGRFFDEHFPGVTELIPPDELEYYFRNNQHLPLVSIKCNPYHYSSTAVIAGDAAHAMVPFYGQGMNAGLEDVRVLFEILDKHEPPTKIGPPTPAIIDEYRGRALEEYSKTRVVDAHAINDLALQNYIEMRSDVLSPMYMWRKTVEEWLSWYMPILGWHTKYSRVSFSNERYSEIVANNDRQGKIFLAVLKTIGVMPVAIGLLGLYYQRHPQAYGHNVSLAGVRELLRSILRRER